MSNLLQDLPLIAQNDMIQHPIPDNLSLANHLLPTLPPAGAKTTDESSGDSKYSKYSKYSNAHLRGTEPPPPTTRFLNCGCIKSTVKFGIPFIIFLCIGALLNWLISNDNVDQLNIGGAFIQTWTPILFILFYLRWRYFRVVLTIELLVYFLLSLACVFPYAFGLVILSNYVANEWNVFDQTLAQWLTFNRFFMLCVNSFFFVAFAVEMYKIIFLWWIYKRKIIACPTALIIYSVVISSSASSMIDALFIITQESVWIGIIIIMISLPINIATGAYEAMYFSTLRFADIGHQSTHCFSIDSMDITIEYNTKKNQVSSKFTFASKSRKHTNDNNVVTNTQSQKSSFAKDFDTDLSYSPTTYNNYSDIDELRGRAYIINFDKHNASKTVFRPYLMFMICWFTHSTVQLLTIFVDALFRECYPTKIFLKDINDGKDDDILCHENAVLWISLLWILILLCVFISLSFIGYIRHLWLLYFKDGIKINVHYLLMCNQVKLPKYCCKCCYFCEIKSGFDEYGVLLSSVRDKRLSSNEQKLYEQMKHQLDNIT